MKNRFEIIPAIDILGGKCVRLTQGKYDLIEEYSPNPIEVAKNWIHLGAKRLHIVDLDGAKNGYPVNYEKISELIKETKGTEVEVGGGIRTIDTAKNYLDVGASYIILGTKIFQDSDFLAKITEKYNDRVIVGLDLKDKKVAVSGWGETLNMNLDTLGNYFTNIRQIICTDTSKDGTLGGPNLNLVKEVSSIFNSSNIIVSGGISKLEDLEEILNIKKTNHPNIAGAILGKSLYKGTIDLKLAIETAFKVLKN